METCWHLEIQNHFTMPTCALMAYDGLCRTLQNVTVQELALSHFFQLCLDMNFAQPQHCQVQLIEQMEQISSYNYIYICIICIYIYICIYIEKHDELPVCHTPKSYQDLLIRDYDVLSSRPHQSPRQALEVGHPTMNRIPMDSPTGIKKMMGIDGYINNMSTPRNWWMIIVWTTQWGGRTRSWSIMSAPTTDPLFSSPSLDYSHLNQDELELELELLCLARQTVHRLSIQINNWILHYV